MKPDEKYTIVHSSTSNDFHVVDLLNPLPPLKPEGKSRDNWLFTGDLANCLAYIRLKEMGILKY